LRIEIYLKIHEAPKGVTKIETVKPQNKGS